MPRQAIRGKPPPAKRSRRSIPPDHERPALDSAEVDRFPTPAGAPIPGTPLLEQFNSLPPNVEVAEVDRFPTPAGAPIPGTPLLEQFNSLPPNVKVAEVDRFPTPAGAPIPGTPLLEQFNPLAPNVEVAEVDRFPTPAGAPIPGTPLLEQFNPLAPNTDDDFSGLSTAPPVASLTPVGDLILRSPLSEEINHQNPQDEPINENILQMAEMSLSEEKKSLPQTHPFRHMLDERTEPQPAIYTMPHVDPEVEKAYWENARANNPYIDADRKKIQAPRKEHGTSRNDKAPSASLITLKTVELFRNTTKELMESRTPRPQGKKQGEKDSRTMLTPEVIEGLSPVLYRHCGDALNGKPVLEAAHYEVFAPDRPDLRYIYIDALTISGITGRPNIDLSKMAYDDLFYVYKVALRNPGKMNKYVPELNPDILAEQTMLPWVAELAVSVTMGSFSKKMAYIMEVVMGNRASKRITMLRSGSRNIANIRPRDFVDRNGEEAKPPHQGEIVWAYGRPPKSSSFCTIEPPRAGKEKEYREAVQGYTRPPPVKPITFAQPLSKEEQDDIDDRFGEAKGYDRNVVRTTTCMEDSMALGVTYRAYTDASKKGDIVAEILLFSVVKETDANATADIEIDSALPEFEDAQRLSLQVNEAEPFEVRIDIWIPDPERNKARAKVSIPLMQMTLVAMALKGSNGLLVTGTLRALLTDPLDSALFRIITTGEGVIIKESRTKMLNMIYSRKEKRARPVEFPDHPVQVKKSDGTIMTMNREQSAAVVKWAGCRDSMIVDSSFGCGKSATQAAMLVQTDLEKEEVIIATAVQHAAVVASTQAFAAIKHGEKRPLRFITLARWETTSEQEKTPFDLPSMVLDVNWPKELRATPALEEKAHKLHLAAAVRNSFRYGSKTAPSQAQLAEFEKASATFQLVYQQIFEDFIKLYRPNILFATTDSILTATLKMGWLREYMNRATSVFVDEASQMTEAGLLALHSAVPRAEFVLIGDENQLPPYKFDGKKIGQLLAGRPALTVALAKGNLPRVRLVQVYRMPQSLVTLPSRLFYNGRIFSNVPEADMSAFTLMGIGSRGPAPFIFVNVEKGKVVPGLASSLANEEEAEVISRIAAAIAVGVEPAQIAVAAFYRQQMKTIHQKLLGRGLHEINVRTVDGFQGKERRIVIVATTKVGAGASKFISEEARVYMALTRARDTLIVVGHQKTLLDLAIWYEVVRYAAKHGTVVESQQLNL